MKAQLVYFCDGNDEAVVIDTMSLNKSQLETEYARSVSAVIPLSDEQAFDIDTWPTDRELTP
jgi:hypothetical protein